jgi:cyclophilin family peptidyl-prolyl cis-trans isomerase
VARPLVLLLCLAMLLVSACGDDDDDGGGSQSEGGGGAAAQSEGEGQADGQAAQQNGVCREVPMPNPKPDGGAKKPTGKLAAGKTYRVVMKTNCGDITVQLDQKTSPKTTASFASLVRQGFYDETIFHRIVPGFVIQGGDPTGQGTGGPGYSVRDKPPADTVYSQGVVAMAKTEVEPAGTSGSQFYIVTAPDAGLPPDYAVLGEVVKGMDVALAIEQLGDPASGGAGTPTQTVLLEKATLK